MTRKHAHYFKPVPAGVTHIDVYRLLDMFNVTDQALGHAIKKLLVAGGRGHKDIARDVQEAIDTLQRRMEMWNEESTCGQPPLCDCDVACEKPDGVRCRSKLAGRVVPDDGWTEWEGGACPVDPHVLVRVKLRHGQESGIGSPASELLWHFTGGPADIIAYRVVPNGS